MIWTISAIAFLSGIFIVAALAYAFAPSRATTGERLARLWRPEAAPSEQGFAEKQRERVRDALTGVGKLLPSSDRGGSRGHRLLIRAGYRKPEAVYIVQAMRIISPLALLGLVYFTGLYTWNPIFILAIAALLGVLLPDIWLTRCVKKRQFRILLALPDALDLLVVCVEAGLGLDQAILRVSQELMITHPELSDELQFANLQVRVGKARTEALRELGERTGVEDIKTLTAMLIQTDRFGTNLADSLRVHSDKLRTKRRQRAEEMAAKTTVKMVVPLVFFIFPALFIVLLGPAVITLVRQFFPMSGH